MMKMRLTIALIAVAHATIWTIILRPGYFPERYEQIAMFLAAAMTASVAIWPSRRIATIAQATQFMAVGLYALITFVWAKHDSEAVEGIALMFMTGAILFVIIPPVTSIVALQILKRKCPIRIGPPLAEPQK
jgi:peptidoglycan/LPS O-acetylase OafA/YrhL